MFSQFNQKIDTIFLDSDSVQFELTDRVNVILSPALYWVKKVTLPVKYTRGVKPLLPSLFEEILPEGNYSYFVYKKNGDYFIFAYEDKKIIDLLKAKGVNPAQVNNVHFAQSEFDEMAESLRIDEHQSLFLKDELVVLLPSIWSENDAVLDISSVKLTKNFINLNQYGHIVDNRSMYGIMGVLALFIVLLSVEFFILFSKNTAVEEAKGEVFAKNNLKSTMIQNRSLLKEYESLHKKQMNLRREMAALLSLKLMDNEKISSLSFKGKKLSVEFSGIAKSRETGIVRNLQKTGLKCTSSLKDDHLHVEVVL